MRRLQFQGAVLDAIKKAITSALQKGNASDKAFREKVYRQLFVALDRSLEGRPGISAEEVRRRREQAKAVIVEIEREYLAASALQPTVTQQPPAAQQPPAQASEQASDFAPRVAREDRLAFEEGSQAAYSPEGERRASSPRRRRGIGRIVLLLAVIAVAAAVGLTLWWIVAGDGQPAGDSAGGPDISQPARNEESASGDTAPARSGEDSAEEPGNWITIFTPTDPTTVSTSPGASAEVMTREGDTFLQISAESAEAAVSFAVGQGVLETLAGKRAVFNLTARAEDGEETQISVTCDFGALGDCGRTRYTVGLLPSDYLFEVEFPDARPGAGGTISVVPDMEGQGRVLEVFSLRVSVLN